MGKVNDVMRHFLSDNERFADLFNGIFFHGQQVILAGDLSEASEQYTEHEMSSQLDVGRRSMRIRDIKKHLKTGPFLRILAVENQNLVDYSMPFRCLQYDVMEYGQQLALLRKENEKAGSYLSMAEKFCKIKKTDKLTPVYTLCLYHGEEKWDGPRTLGEMMDFGESEDKMASLFADYPMKLYCINESDDFTVFHSEIKALFQAMSYRADKAGMRKLLQEDLSYRHLSEDTVETLAVMLNIPGIWKNRERYMQKNAEKEDYNMCLAIQEWKREEREEGKEEGREEGIRAFIEICREFGLIKEAVAAKIKTKFMLEEDQTQIYIERYWE